MKKTNLIFLIIFCMQLLSCDSVKRGLGLEKNAPDEFLVQKRQSILLPPDYNLLPPDSNVEVKVDNKDQDLKSILNKELNQNTKLYTENKNTKVNSQSKEIENKILNNIK